jgi:hypothetical protein
MEICGSGSGPLMHRTDDDYDWTQDAIGSYALAIKVLRESYLANRLPGESAKEWLERTGE